MSKSKNNKVTLGIAVIALAVILFLVALLKGGSKQESANIRVGSLKGPTSMGLLFMMEDAKAGQTINTYEFTMVTGADELLPLMVKGEMDIALVPANVAAVLYKKTEGQVSVIDINTLGVLYMVSKNGEISDIKDLSGKSIYLTGKGTTPDFVLQYLLSENDILDTCTLEYKSEATEVVSAMTQADGDVVGLLPQPFVTAACAQNEELSIVIDMNEAWSKVNPDCGMVTGVTVVRNEFLNENEGAVKTFLKEHKESADRINEDVEKGAEYAVEKGLIAAAPIAVKAIPKCNITCISGEEMKQALAGYLEVIYEKSAEFVGGAVPAEDFYYIP